MKRATNRYAVIAIALCALAGVGAFAQPDAVRPAGQAEPVAAQPIPVVDAVVASPRATLVPLPFPTLTDAELTPVRSVGAAWNFAARDMTLRMRFGSVLHTRLSDEIEGVWHARARGYLGTLLVLEMQDYAGNWRVIGKDGAAAHRHGPSIGAAAIGVRYRPPRPGRYHLRARIMTYAIPTRPDPTAETAENDTERKVVVQDEVHIRLYVIRRPVAEPLKYQEPIVEMPRELLDPEGL